MRWAVLIASGLALGLPVAAEAGKEAFSNDAAVGRSAVDAMAQLRRRPGEPPPAPYVEPPADPNALPRPDFRQPNLPKEFVPVPDRWRLIESIGVNEKWWDPYNQNTLKGDRPVFDDWFVNISVISDTVYEPSAFPKPVGIQAPARAGALDNFTDTKLDIFNQNLILNVSFIKGDTAYKPPDYEIRISPVLNYNYVKAEDTRILHVDADRGTDRSDRFVGWQELFFDYHIRNVSDRYDFDSIRVGIQPFSSDFRGFVFQDLQLGARLFGNRDNNIFQYNLAAFQRLEKDTNSGLNDLTKQPRRDYVFIANLFWQDMPVKGFVSQATVMHNKNTEAGSLFFNTNGFIERPGSLGDERRRNYDVTYLGLNGDGHFGRLNLTGSLYYAFGTDDHNQFSGQKDADIRAWFAAFEPSIDFSWIRLRGSALYASGDDDPFDNRSEGFDAIFENPQFAGGDTSFWIRQGVPLIGGGGVQLSNRNSVLPALRTSKEHGQSNFNNPGLTLLGFGTDFDLTPEIRLSTNVNRLDFVDTSSLEFLRNQGDIDTGIGWDVSAALIWRPMFIQNVVFRLSGAVLFADDGFKQLYRTNNDSEDTFYSVLANLILTY